MIDFSRFSPAWVTALIGIGTIVGVLAVSVHIQREQAKVIVLLRNRTHYFARHATWSAMMIHFIWHETQMKMPWIEPPPQETEDL